MNIPASNVPRCALLPTLGTALLPQLRYRRSTIGPTGCYIGGNLGGAWAHKNWTDVTVPTIRDSGSHTADGILGGGQIGCNVQAGSFVFGIERMYDWANLNGSNVDDFGQIWTTRVDGLATVTGRLGYAIDRVMIYAKGGAAWIRDSHTLTGGTPAQTLPAKLTRTGWTVGTGLEYPFAAGWSGKIEYNYLDFGTEAVNFCDLTGCAVADFRQKVHLVLIGINYRWAPMSR